MVARSERRQHAGEDLESQVLFVAQPIGTALEHADPVVQPLDEAERDPVLRGGCGIFGLRTSLTIPSRDAGWLRPAQPRTRAPPYGNENGATAIPRTSLPMTMPSASAPAVSAKTKNA